MDTAKTVKCAPPLGIECGYPAAEAVEIKASFLPPAPAVHAICELHVSLLAHAGFEIHRLEGHARNLALHLVPAAIVGGVPRDAAPGELMELFGK